MNSDYVGSADPKHLLVIVLQTRQTSFLPVVLSPFLVCLESNQVKKKDEIMKSNAKLIEPRILTFCL